MRCTAHELMSWLLVACITLYCSWGHAGSLTGRVVAVIDGDTIKLLDSQNQIHKIRLLGIDAPEKKQPFGQRSKQNLSDEVFGQDIVVEYRSKDRDQRVLGQLFKDGQDINLKQVQDGLAWHFKVYARNQLAKDRQPYALAEIKAREDSKGLWADAGPIAPWEWRHRKKTQGSQSER